MGDMGLSVGTALLSSGIEVLTNLDGRSIKTVQNVKSGNILNVTQTDLIKKVISFYPLFPLALQWKLQTN